MKGFNHLRDSRRRTELAVKSWQEANEALILAKLEQLRTDDTLPLPDPERKEAIRQLLLQKCRQVQREREAPPVKSVRRPERIFRTLALAAALFGCLSLTAFAYYRNFVLTDYGIYTDVNVETDAEDINERVLEYYYQPEYIPEGFLLADESFYSNDISFTYLTNEKQYLTVVMWTNNGTAINTENMETLPQETINGFQCSLYSKEDNSTSCIIIDHGECFIYVYGDLPPDEIVKIAENLKPITMPDVGEGYSKRYF